MIIYVEWSSHSSEKSGFIVDKCVWEPEYNGYWVTILKCGSAVPHCYWLPFTFLKQLYDFVLHTDSDNYWSCCVLFSCQIEDVDLAVKRNQALIVKNYCQYSDTFHVELFGEDKEKQERRWKILTQVKYRHQTTEFKAYTVVSNFSS